jgi:hypothetical protein
MMSPPSQPLLACVAAVIVAAAACAGGFLARGTTAVPAAGWAGAAALVFAVETGARAAGWFQDPTAAAAFRLVSMALAVCPTMALLGAKRPQHGVWQFIVGSLALVLVMPAVSATLVRPGTMPDVHALQRWFMPLLVVVGWMNFAATRHGPSATLVAIGQMLLLRPFLPFASEITAADFNDCVGAVLVAGGAALAALQSIGWPAVARSARARPGQRGDLAAPDPVAAIESPFLALRETLGAAWTLRIAERFNSVAATRGWPCRLRFAGLVVTGDPSDDSWQRDAIRGGAALFRRFVSAEWLQRHVPHPVLPAKNGPEVAPAGEGR